MDTETFRISLLRTPFVVMGLALLAWIVLLPVFSGPGASASYRAFGAEVFILGLAVVLAPLAFAGLLHWYFGVVQVGPEGIALYRMHRLRWTEITKAKELSFLGLPYLRLWPTSGLPWLVPLYIVGATPLVCRLQAWCPSNSPIVSTLIQLSKFNSQRTEENVT